MCFYTRVFIKCVDFSSTIWNNISVVLYPLITVRLCSVCVCVHVYASVCVCVCVCVRACV